MKFWGEFNEGAIYKVWVSKPVRNVQAPGILREETNTTPSPEETRGRKQGCQQSVLHTAAVWAPSGRC